MKALKSEKLPELEILALDGFLEGCVFPAIKWLKVLELGTIEGPMRISDLLHLTTIKIFKIYGQVELRNLPSLKTLELNKQRLSLKKEINE